MAPLASAVSVTWPDPNRPYFGGISFLRSKLRPLTTLKAYISSKPAKHPVSTGEQAFVMTVMFATVLGPSGWVLAHLEEYKAR